MHAKLPSFLAYETAKLTEAAAIACLKWVGKGKEKEADAAAVKALRAAFDHFDASATVVIGEGERDDAPMLFIGEKLGNTKSSLKVDIAVDPLEGTTICANAADNSLSVIAIAPFGTMLHAPDVYMEKIAVGVEVKKGEIDLDNPISKNLINLARIKDCEVSELTVCILNRQRHDSLISQIRSAGAKIQLIEDGDVAAIIATSFGATGVDLYVGTGGAPEGVLAAAALKSLGGFMQGRLIFKDESEKKRAIEKGINDLTKKYLINDMVKADVIFSATAVTNGWMLNGAEIDEEGGKVTNTLLMHHSEGTIQTIDKRVFKAA